MSIRLCVLCNDRAPVPGRSHGLCPECIAETNRVECAAAGVPEFVDDPVALSKVATLMRASAFSASPTSRPSAGAEIGAATQTETDTSAGLTPPAPSTPATDALRRGPAVAAPTHRNDESRRSAPSGPVEQAVG